LLVVVVVAIPTLQEAVEGVVPAVTGLLAAHLAAGHLLKAYCL